MSGDLKPRSLKISDLMWVAWQARAKVRGISLTALIIERMENDTQVRIAVLEADKASLNDLLENALAIGTRAHERIAYLEKEIEALRRERHDVDVRLLRRGPPLPADIDQKVHHSAGPVMKSAIPQIEGDTAWSGLKEKKS